MQGLSYPFDSPPSFGDPIEVTAAVRWLRMPLPWSLDHVNLYLLTNEHGWTLIDTGLCTPEAQRLWQPLIKEGVDGRPITEILLTHHHPDHIGAASWLSEQLGAAVSMHPNEYQAATAVYPAPATLETPLYETLYQPLGLRRQDADQLHQIYANWGMGIDALPANCRTLTESSVLQHGADNWQLHYSQGHSPGQLAPFCPKRRVLLSGDLVLPKISSNISVTPWNPERNPLAAEMQGLDRLRNLPADTLVLPAHGLPFRGLHARIDQLQSEWLDRLASITGHCVEPKHPLELIPLLFREGLTGLDQALAVSETLSYLSYLLGQGELERIRDSNGDCRFLATPV
ncbi:MAG: MBL fold metallo-hydrolase [Motiliproteus sp.]